MKIHQFIASCGGIGHIKGGGTLAAILYAIVWHCFPASWHGNWPEVLILIGVITQGTWSSDCVEAVWGKDSSIVVIDEVAGMAVSLFCIPVNIYFTAVSLVLFRFFDILKPLGISRLENWKGGWGVMADDLLSGIYAWLILQLIVRGMPDLII
jgi:phosphatidylglycerophosphatase A